MLVRLGQVPRLHYLSTSFRFSYFDSLKSGSIQAIDWNKPYRMRLLHRLLLKPYLRWMGYTFALRESLGRPVVVSVGKTDRVRLLPEGQIARSLHFGSYEGVERRLVCRLLKAGMTVIDIGANVGLYSLISERLVSPSGRVWAIEPALDSYDRLLRNLELNATSLTTPVKTALSAQDDDFAVLVRDRGFFDGERYLLPDGGQLKGTADSERVPTTSLNTFCSRRNIRAVDFIKMDIEGGEYEVLKGAGDILEGNPGLVMLFEHTREGCARAGTTPQVVLNLLARYGFQLYAWDLKKKSWRDDHDYILSKGNAWAVKDRARLPRL